MRRFVISFLILGTALTGAARGADSVPEDLWQAHHLKRLRTWAEARVAANPNDAQAEYYLASVKEEFGDLDGALPLAEKLVSLDASNARYHLLLADICIAQAQKAGVFKGLGLARRFRDEASKAASLDPKYIESREDLMEYYFDAPGIAGGDKKKAWALADEIGKIDGVRGLLAHATLAGKEKNYGKEDALYQQALTAAPHDPRVLRHAAAFYASDSQKNYNLAEKSAIEDIEFEEDRGASYAVLAVVYADLERWKDLDAIIALSEKDVPDDFGSHYQAAKILLLSGKDLPRAERYFRRYLTIDPEAGEPPWSGAHWRLGQVLEKEGKKTEAIAEMQEAVRLQPDLKPAKDDLTRLKK
ncbi:MAG: tetratricopeptide repeat protein [Terriglobales bacterium]|jgi:tetratricopeptide (TPR) repeat protein